MPTTSTRSLFPPGNQVAAQMRCFKQGKAQARTSEMGQRKTSRFSVSSPASTAAAIAAARPCSPGGGTGRRGDARAVLCSGCAGACRAAGGACCACCCACACRRCVLSGRRTAFNQVTGDSPYSPSTTHKRKT